MKANKQTIILVIVLALIFGAAGFFFGKRWYEPEIKDSNAVIDSLVAVNELLYDSLMEAQKDVEYVDRVVVQYKTKYDTIRVYEDHNQILESLRQIANTPPSE